MKRMASSCPSFVAALPFIIAACTGTGSASQSSGTSKAITVREGTSMAVAVSPDGRTLAYSVRERARTGSGFETVLRVRRPDGSIRELLRERAVSLMSWAPDGDAVYVVRHLSAANATPTVPDQLWRVPLDGSAPTFTGVRAPSLRGVSMHPDGRTVAYVTGLPTWEIWAMEGIR